MANPTTNGSGSRPYVKGGWCRDCGQNQASKNDFFCGRCRRRHHPKSKTYAILRFYERREHFR